MLLINNIDQLHLKSTRTNPEREINWWHCYHNNNNNLVTRDAENGYGISRVNCEFLPTNNKSNFVFSIPTG